MMEYAEKNISDAEDLFDKENSACLKGIAICMMMVHHCFMSQDRYAGHDIVFVIPEAVWNYVALFFKICVCLFVFVSAYGITKKLMAMDASGELDRTPRTVLRRVIVSRLVRLIGSFAFVFLLICLFALFYDPGRFVSIYGSVFPACLEYWLIDLLGLAELLGTPTFLGTFWYYSLAILVIFLAPAFYLLVRKTGGVLCLGLVLIFNLTVEIPNTDIWRYLFCIAVGVVCANGNIISGLIRLQPGKSPEEPGARVGTGNESPGETKARGGTVSEDQADSEAGGRTVIRMGGVRRSRAGRGHSRAVKFMLELAVLLLLMVLREGPLKNVLYPFWDGVIPVAVSAFCCEFVFAFRPIRRILRFLGKHSVNIFPVHNFFRVVWFNDFTFSFRYPLVIVTVLLLVSLAVSILVEALKRMLRYNLLLDRLIRILGA